MTREVFGHFALSLVLLLGALFHGGRAQAASEDFVPGPDIVVGNMADLAYYGVGGTQLGLGMGTTVCNAGNAEVNIIALPNTDHPVIAHNLYRMSGGSSNNERFEQIGQSWVKHTFGATDSDECGFGCVPTGDITRLGVGCSDSYASSQNATQDALGSRAWVNPFTGVFQSSARDHSGHIHTGTSHRILVESNDLNTTMNPGATYYAEVQYITPDENAWCQAHPGECNMFNNASYRRFNVTPSFTFAPVGATVRTAPAINAWTGATINPIEPAPGSDGRAFIAYKVTNLSAEVWHYEYAVYNQNLDRGIRSFSVPLGGLITVSNLGFHAPLNHPGFPNDGTLGDAGYSNAAWISTQTASELSWSTETFAQDQNANAIRWGTLYSFRFDSNRPPQATNAMIGFFKTGAPITVGIQGPDSSDATPTPIPSVTPSATATPTPALTPTPTPTPGGHPAQTRNLSTRMRVGTGDNVGIGGFIVPRLPNGHATSRRVIIRALGPSLAVIGVPGTLADPVLELSGSGLFNPITNDNWRDTQAAEIEASGLAPSYDLESAIAVELPSGNYTAVVRGKNQTTGAALVEVYAIQDGAGLPNLSTRAVVGAGDDIVIGGFILGGYKNTGLARIVVRGLGPGLSFAGVPDTLEDPTLELRDGNGALLIANNDWRDDPIQAAELIASGLATLLDQTESAIVVTLPPGVYTALLAGRNNGTGVGLIEVYNRDDGY